MKPAASNLARRWDLPGPIIKPHPEEKWVWPWTRELSKIWRFFSVFTQWLKLATSNFACRWGLPSSIIKSHPEEKWAWPWTRGTFQNLGFTFNISATAEASNFQFCMRLGSAKAHHKITPRGKVGVALG